MGWLDRFRTKTPTPPDQARALTPPVYRFGSFRNGISGTSQQPEAVRLVTDGFSGIQATAARAIANRVSSLELRVQERRRVQVGTALWEDNDEHPLLAALERPNPLLSMRQLLKVTSYWLTQTGEAYWLIVTNGAGATRELWPMSPSHIEKVSSDAAPISAFVFHSEGGETRYALDEVIFMYDPDPADPFTGVGIVGPQARDFDSGTFASDTVRQHFKHDATPKTVLKAQPEATAPNQEQKELFYADWVNRYNKRAGEDVGLPAFLPSGFDLQEIAGASNVDEARGMMEFLRDGLLMANGVPRSILGDVVDANRAAADTNRLVFDRHTIKPQAGLICDALSYQLAVPEFGTNTRVCFAEFVDEDQDLRLREESQDLTLKVRSIDQVREDRGLDPVEWGEKPVGSFADQPYDPTGEGDDDPVEFGPAANPFDPDNEPEDDEPDDDDEGRALARERANAFIVRSVAPRIAKHFTPEAAWSRVMQAEAAFVPRMVSAMRRVFAGQKALTLDALAKQFEELRDRGAAYSRGDFVDRLFEGEDFTRLFDVLVTPIREDVYTKAAENVLFGLEHKPILQFDQAAILTMREQGAELVTFANDTSKKRIRNTLADGIASGDNLEQMATRVRKVFNAAGKSRSRTIARTEVGHAISSGQLAGYEQSKVVAQKQWNTALDDRVRDTHGGPGHIMDGVRVGLLEAFTLLDGEKALAPRVAIGGGRLSAHNGINCRCFDTPIVDGDQAL